MFSQTPTDFSLSTSWDFSADKTCDRYAGETLFSRISIPPSPDPWPYIPTGMETGIMLGPLEGLVMGVV